MNKEEMAIQNIVADYYETIRFKLDYSRKYYQWWFEKMISLGKPRGLVLDDGCGTGELGEFLKGHKIVGVDISPGMLKYAKKRLSKVYQADACSLPFEDESFETVFCKTLLHHLPDSEKGLKEIYRVLKPGGTAIFSEPIISTITYLPRVILKKWRLGKNFSSLHRSFYRKELIDLIKRRLKVIEVYQFGFLAYTFLAFPEILGVYQYVPGKKVLTPFLIKLEGWLAKVPLINRWGLQMIVVAQKP